MKKKRKTNKHALVRKHLEEYGSITSWKAIELYGATRLSSIIFNLRKDGLDIETIDTVDTDRYGNTCRYAEYIYRGEK